MRNFTQRVSVVFTVFVLASCATTHMRSATTRASFDQVFEAAKQAVQENGYAITSTDAASGFISAAQYVVGGPGSQVRVNITVKKSDPVAVDISVVPPPGTIGDSQAIANKILNSIKNRVPDLVI